MSIVEFRRFVEVTRQIKDIIRFFFNHTYLLVVEFIIV